MAHTIYKNKNDKRLKSVTTIINGNLGWNKGNLLGWTRKHCLNGVDSLKMLKESGNIGTLAHKMIEEYINGGSVCLDGYTPNEISQAKTAYYGFHKWFEDNDVEFYETELKLVSEEYQFGGTMDAVCEVNGKLILADWKTSSDIYSEYLIQAAAYRQLYTEYHNYDHWYKIKGATILKLNKDENGYVEHKFNISDLNWGWKMFKLLLKIQENKR